MQRHVLAVIATGSLGLLTLAGCGATQASAAPAPSASADTAQTVGNGGAHPRLRRYLRRHVEHGQVTVRTRKGDKDVAFQRGKVTAVHDGTLTVSSPDGYKITWTLTDQTRYRSKGSTSDASALATQDKVGVVGVHSGDTYTARGVRIGSS